MPRPKNHGGAPSLGSGLAPQEPQLPTSAQDVQGFAGSPTLQTHINRAGKSVVPPTGEVFPAPYGGAPANGEKRSNIQQNKGGGANTGPGATTAPAD